MPAGPIACTLTLRAAHPATSSAVAAAPRALDELRRAADHGADGCGQALRDAEGDGIDRTREIRRGTSQRDGRVEEPRAVEMHGHTGLVGDGGHRGRLLGRAARAAVTIV